MNLLSLVKAEKSDLESIKNSISISLDLINYDFDRDINNIIIKPNLCYYHDPSTGEVTDPNFIGALIDFLRERLSSGIQIFVVESDASAMRCEYAFKMLGYEKLAKDKSITLVNLTKEKSENFELKINNKHFEILIPQIFQESDLFINVPKIKYMENVKISCALKNIYGCNAYPNKSQYHKILNETIVELNKYIKTDLVILDGIIVRGISTKKLGLIMSCKDPVAIDAAASKIAGIDPKSVILLELANKKGIGSLNYIERGEKINYFRDLFPRKRPMDNVKKVLASIYFKLFPIN